MRRHRGLVSVVFSVRNGHCITTAVRVDYFGFEEGLFVCTGKNWQTGSHSHFFLEVVFSLSGSFTIGTCNRQYAGNQAAIIGPSVRHTFSCLESECQLLFFDPTTDIGQRIISRHDLKRRGLVTFDAFGAEELKKEYDLSVLDHEVRTSRRFSKGIDRRIQTCLNIIEAVDTEEAITVAKLAEKSFLSASRLAHLFKEQLGISVRQYVLWKRIEIALKKWHEGRSFTESAHSAGFSDSSHFNRVVKKMFGVKPSLAQKA
jgi:AraC-like DNA-binding protein